MSRILQWGAALLLAFAIGDGWGQTTGKKKVAHPAKDVPAKQRTPASIKEDSIKHMRYLEARGQRLEEHQRARREQYLARLTPEDRARAEESERRREVHMRVQDSLSTHYMARAREQLRLRAETQRAEAAKAKPAVKSAPVQGGKQPAKKK